MVKETGEVNWIHRKLTPSKLRDSVVKSMEYKKHQSIDKGGIKNDKNIDSDRTSS